MPFAISALAQVLPPQGSLWQAVLGEAAAHVAQLLAPLRASPLAECPALVLADQSKAFERIALRWLHE
eukprot:8865509-Alexandrium_andersonii.AAC.1